MNKSTHGHFMIILAVALIIIAVGWYVFLYKPGSDIRDLGSLGKDLLIESSAGISADSAKLLGEWKSLGGDYQSVFLTLSDKNTFFLKETFSNIDFEAIGAPGDLPAIPSSQTHSGKWTVMEKNGQRYLKLTYDDDIIQTPLSNEMIEQYKRWGQEFPSNNETLIKLSYDGIGTMYFYYNSALLMKLGGVSSIVGNSSLPMMDVKSENMNFSVKAPKGWFAGDEMSGHYTISQTEATGANMDSNFALSILRKTDEQIKYGRGYKPDSQFIACGNLHESAGDQIMIEGTKVRIDYYCDISKTVLFVVSYKKFNLVGESVSADQNHGEHLKIFADIVSSFKQ